MTPYIMIERESVFMNQLNATKFSSKYLVRKLTEEDIPLIYSMCLGNQQYYQYCTKHPTIDLIKSDLKITPPGIDISKNIMLASLKKKHWLQ